MKVSFFVHNLGGNPVVRIVPIARAFEWLGWEAEVLGFLFGEKPVFGAYSALYKYRTVSVKGYVWQVFAKGKRLGEMATGDIVYAGKPLISSFWPALTASGKGKRRPVFLDVEDDDVISSRINGGVDFLRKVRYLHISGNYLNNAWLRCMIRHCSGVTVSSTKLQGYYGGKRLLHGSGMAVEGCPLGAPRQRELRDKWLLPKEKICLFFAGKARRHKGLSLFLEAVANREDDLFQLVLAGDPDQDIFVETKAKLGDACSLVGLIAHDDMGSFVQACDVGLVLQENTEYAESQVPAKLLEAFQYGRPVVTTAVGDLPLLVGKGSVEESRGWILPNRTVDDLREVLDAIARDFSSGAKEARHKGEAAIRFFEENASTEAIAKVLMSFPEIAKRTHQTKKL